MFPRFRIPFVVEPIPGIVEPLPGIVEPIPGIELPGIVEPIPGIELNDIAEFKLRDNNIEHKTTLLGLFLLKCYVSL